MSNNPFLTEEDKYLEQGSSIAAPPPAYEDVVRPGYSDHPYGYPPNNQSFPPPSFPPPTVPNYNHNPLVSAENHQPNSANPNEKSGYRVCCVKFSSRNKACCYGWLVLITFIILGTISVANNKACSQIQLNENPEKFTFDPKLILKLDVEGSQHKVDAVNVLQNPSPDETNVNVEVFTGSSSRVTPQFEKTIQNDSFVLRVFQKVGFGVFNIPPRCMRLKINVILPQGNAGNPTFNNIQVKELNLKLIKDESDKPYQQSIGLSTVEGDIQLEEIKGNIIDIKTQEGNVGGSILSLSKELSVSTDDGNVDLNLGIAPNAMVMLQTDNGNVGLTMVESSFAYKVRTNDGNIRINDEMINGLSKNGMAGDGKSIVNIITDEGNIRLNY
ncbi:10849_t:CDS:2 [Funneliformis mosseae]|uniref:10849_t:CDS:1 n=1 Tax=Funneliformis mosseae TaxID=27381 RepID=A0A9N9DL46_FUNMO|nr:10849_t:CDS:2 [Funneliformis mosseae]